MESNQRATLIVLRPANNDEAWRALWEWLLAPGNREVAFGSQSTDESAPHDDDEVTDDDI